MFGDTQKFEDYLRMIAGSFGEISDPINDFDSVPSPWAVSIVWHFRRLQEEIRLIDRLPLSERLLAWSECERLLHSPPTEKTTTPHASE